MTVRRPVPGFLSAFRYSPTVIGLAATAAAAILAALSAQVHPASLWSLFLFHLAFIALFLLALPAPRSHAFSAFAGMLLLGYWPKFLVRLISPSPYLEPIGAFDGSTAGWDTALVVAAVGIGGVAACRLIQLRIGRRDVRAVLPITAPGLYHRWRWPLWGLSAVTMLIAYAWNSYAAVYATGVNPRVVLPFGLDIILAWCYIMAFPLWIAILIGWELASRRDGRLGWGLLAVPVAEAILNAGSLLSRATYLLRIAPYFLASTRRQLPALALPRPLPVTLSALGLGFALSVVAVMALRTVTYYGPAPDAATPAPPPQSATSRPGQAPTIARPDERARTPAAAAVPGPAASSLGALQARRLPYMINEVNSLFLDRWTGLEGVLAVSASPARNFGTLMAAVREDPAVGNDAIYQRMAGSSYVRQDRFTFLTLAGIIGLFAMSGSLVVVSLGMALVTAGLMAAEWVLRSVTRNELACSVVAVSAAFVTAQVTFPKLYGVFLLELWLTLGALAVLAWSLARLDRIPR